MPCALYLSRPKIGGWWNFKEIRPEIDQRRKSNELQENEPSSLYDQLGITGTFLDFSQSH